MVRRCSDCKIEKDSSEFNKNGTCAGGLSSYCKTCSVARHRKWVKANKERVRACYKAWREKNPDKVRVYANRIREHEDAIRDECISAYGGICSHCGETDDFVLEIDHVFNDGNKHRKETRLHSLYRWLKKHGYPQGRFQLLCGNCNIAKERNGGILPPWRKGLRRGVAT